MSDPFVPEASSVDSTASAESGATGSTKPSSRGRKSPKRPQESTPAELAAQIRSGITLPTASVAALASLLKMPTGVIAAVKTFRGWNDNTLVSEQELREAATSWLDAPANHGGKKP